MPIVHALSTPTPDMTSTSFSVPPEAKGPHVIDSEMTTSSPPSTPPSKIASAESGMAMLTDLPSPPPSSSSRYQRAPDQRHDMDEDMDEQRRHHHSLSTYGSTHTPPSSELIRPPPPPSSHNSLGGIAPKTHSSSSSTSSSSSFSYAAIPAALVNKHISLTKTKTLGHLTRSTSSEVDYEVASALASGRSIVSKTDWKEDDAVYLVQLIEKQFPKGNIIWDWVGQQMANRGFTKSQCRSKWKRIRTKVLHGSDGSIRDHRDNIRDHEPDELIEDDEDDIPDYQPHQEPSHWYEHAPPPNHHSRDYSESEPPYRSDARGYYDDRPFSHRDDHRAATSPPPSTTSRTRPAGHSNGRLSYSTQGQPVENGLPEEDELWSDDEHSSRYAAHARRDDRYRDRVDGHRSTGAMTGQEKESNGHHLDRSSRSYPSSHNHSPVYRRQSGAASSPQTAEASEEPPRMASTSYGKIEWKTEDSDYLVHLIETKFASRKVDWAWVSKQMEGRGYDRTQCKSRWWRVQHRQGSQSQSQQASNAKQQNADRQSEADLGATVIAKEKAQTWEGDDAPTTEEGSTKFTTRDPSTPLDSAVPASRSSSQALESSTPKIQQLPEPSMGGRGGKRKGGGMDDDGRASPRPRTQEHQKHVEWKEEDSQYMFRLIEKEFPVGNIVWGVIAERMQGRGYSQTQCMSKWRRHLKSNKLANEAKINSGMDIDNDPVNPGSRRDKESRLSEEAGVYTDRGPYSTVDYGHKRVRIGDSDQRRYDASIDYGSSMGSIDARPTDADFDRYYGDAGARRKKTDRMDYSPNSSKAPSYYRDAPSPYEDSRSRPREYPRDQDRGRERDRERDQERERASHRQDGTGDDMHADQGSKYEISDPSAEHTGYNGRDGYSRPSASQGGAADVGVSASGGSHSRPPHDDYEKGYDYGHHHRSDNHDMAPPSHPQDEEYGMSRREPSFSRSDYPRRSYHESVDESRDENTQGPRDSALDHAGSVQPPSQPQTRHRPSEPIEEPPIGRDSEQSFMGTSGPSDQNSQQPRQHVHRSSRAEESVGEYRARKTGGPDEPDREAVDRGYYDADRSAGRHSPSTSRQSAHHHRRSYDYGPGSGHDHGQQGSRNGRHSRSSTSANHYPYSHRERDSHSSHHSRYSHHGHGSYDSEPMPPSAGLDFDEDMDWGLGRWDGREMARLTASVARHGRRWDVVRERIRIPILVNPYENEDVYEGVQFDTPYWSQRHEGRRSSRIPASEDPSYSSRTSHGGYSGHHRHSSSSVSATHPSEGSRGYRRDYGHGQETVSERRDAAVSRLEASRPRAKEGRRVSREPSNIQPSHRPAEDEVAEVNRDENIEDRERASRNVQEDEILDVVSIERAKERVVEREGSEPLSVDPARRDEMSAEQMEDSKEKSDEEMAEAEIGREVGQERMKSESETKEVDDSNAMVVDQESGQDVVSEEKKALDGVPRPENDEQQQQQQQHSDLQHRQGEGEDVEIEDATEAAAVEAGPTTDDRPDQGGAVTSSPSAVVTAASARCEDSPSSSDATTALPGKVVELAL